MGFRTIRSLWRAFRTLEENAIVLSCLPVRCFSRGGHLTEILHRSGKGARVPRNRGGLGCCVCQARSGGQFGAGF